MGRLRKESTAIRLIGVNPPKKPHWMICWCCHGISDYFGDPAPEWGASAAYVGEGITMRHVVGHGYAAPHAAGTNEQRLYLRRARDISLRSFKHAFIVIIKALHKQKKLWIRKIYYLYNFALQFQSSHQKSPFSTQADSLLIGPVYFFQGGLSST